MTPLLETVGLTRRFGGLEAVRGVDFRVARGELRAIIGPNGAGKTTFFNLISGRDRVTSGTIRFKGRDITRLPAHRVARLGIARTLQVTSVFPALTVWDNLWVAAESRRRVLNPFGSVARDSGSARRVDEVAGAIGLGDRLSEMAGNLSHGDQRLLEIGLALCTDPELLLLDEPTAGLSQKEVPQVVAAIRGLAGRLTILIVEHRMGVVMDLASRITVLDRGSVFAEGSPDEIMSHAGVQEIYLGRRAYARA